MPAQRQDGHAALEQALEQLEQALEQALQAQGVALRGPGPAASCRSSKRCHVVATNPKRHPPASPYPTHHRYRNSG